MSGQPERQTEGHFDPKEMSDLLKMLLGEPQTDPEEFDKIVARNYGIHRHVFGLASPERED